MVYKTAMSIKEHIFLTGLPGIGKTTLIRKVCEELLSRSKNGSQLSIFGFYTEEIREPDRGW